eukprot:403364459
MGGVMEDETGIYLSIYDIDFKGDVQKAFLYKRIDQSNDQGYQITIKDLEIDYQQSYIFACYNGNSATLQNARIGFLYQPIDSSKTSKNLEISLATGDTAACLGMGYLNNNKVITMFFLRWDSTQQKNRIQYIGSGLSGYDTEGTDPPIRVDLQYSFEQYPSTALNHYRSAAFNKNFRIRFVIGTLPGFINIYELITSSGSLFPLGQISLADKNSYYEILNEIVIKEDLRVNQISYSDEKQDCYYALSDCKELINLTFQIVSRNDTKQIYFSKNTTTGAQEHYVSFARNDLEKLEPLKIYNLSFDIYTKFI